MAIPVTAPLGATFFAAVLRLRGVQPIEPGTLDAADADVMPGPYPTQSAFEVGGLAAEVRVEIEAIAVQ